MIDRRYPLEEIADAYRHVETGHKQGNVVLTVGSPKEPRLGTLRKENDRHVRRP